MKLETYAAIKLPTTSARILRSAVLAAGLDWAPIAATAGLSPETLDDPKGFISGSQEMALQSAFVAATDPVSGRWFQLGLEYRIMSYGPFGLTVMASGTFGAGLQAIVSFMALTYSLLDYRLVMEDAEAVGLEVYDSQVPEDCRAFCQHRSLGAATRMLNDMHPSLTPIERIETVLPGPSTDEDWAELLGAPVTFGAPRTRWIFRPGAGREPLPMANPLLEQTYAELCTQLIDDAEVSDEIVNQLYNLLVRSDRNFPNAPEAATQLGLSERTLYRRLAGQGLTFGQMLERVREQRAVYLLQKTDLSVERIADTLGFAETASFSRAFKRWTGSSPFPFRNRMKRLN